MPQRSSPYHHGDLRAALVAEAAAMIAEGGASSVTMREIGRRVGLSTTPCWRRIQKLEEDGVITGRVALLNPERVNTRVTAFVSITTSQHNEEWLRRFAEVFSSPIAQFHLADAQTENVIMAAQHGVSETAMQIWLSIENHAAIDPRIDLIRHMPNRPFSERDLMSLEDWRASQI